jgi:hypothetical protein
MVAGSRFGLTSDRNFLCFQWNVSATQSADRQTQYFSECDRLGGQTLPEAKMPDLETQQRCRTLGKRSAT